MKFESGYTVETVFDGSKLGIDPYSVEMSPSGELLILDAENSNIYKISMPLSRCKHPFGSPFLCRMMNIELIICMTHDWKFQMEACVLLS